MTIAVSEVKIENGREMTETDHEIKGYTINPFNLERNPNIGRGIIIYTHNSLSLSFRSPTATSAWLVTSTSRT